MPHFHFHVTFRGTHDRDDNGLHLPDRVAAWKEATCARGEIIKAIDGELLSGDKLVMEVEDEGGPVFMLTVSAAQIRG